MVWGRGGPTARDGSQYYDQQQQYDYQASTASGSTPVTAATGRSNTSRPSPTSTRNSSSAAPYSTARRGNRAALNPNNPRLNASLQTQYLDLGDPNSNNNVDDDFFATTTRAIAKTVGSILTPGQVLGMLRVLRAATLSFLALSLVSMLMYLLFVQTSLAATQEVRRAAGGIRDVVLRLYGIALALLLVGVELDVACVMQRFAVCKRFLPRACVFGLVAQLCAPRPIAKELAQAHSNNNGNQYYYSHDDGQVYSDYEPPEIPTSAIGFQRVTSFLLTCCALGYLVCGLLCLDRFTARAFVSRKDPRITTAIPAPQPPQQQPPAATAALSDESSLFGEDDDCDGLEDAAAANTTSPRGEPL